MDSAPDVPEATGRLRRFLEGEGFTPEEEATGGGFGDRLVVYRRGELAVRLVSDRGEWFVDATCGDGQDWFDADLWRAWLDHAPPGRPVGDLGEQVDVVVAVVPRLSEAVEAQGCREVLERLSALRADRLRGT